MTDDLSTLPQPVREAVEYCDGIFDDADNGEWATIRAELLRLARENADLRSTIDLDEQVWIQREETLEGWIKRARKAEVELAKLRARIVDAHRIYGFSGPDTLGIWLTYPGEPLALVKLEDGE
jgi:hypothetical protein